MLSETDFQLGAVAPEEVAVVGGTVSIGELEGVGNEDKCPDFTHSVSGGATLKDYAFSTVSCLAFRPQTTCDISPFVHRHLVIFIPSSCASNVLILN